MKTLLLFVLIAPPCFAQDPDASLLSYYLNDSKAELSGLYVPEDQKPDPTILIVSDSDSEHPFLYRLDLNESHMQTRVFSDLSTFTGFSDHPKFKAFDLEGVTGCGKEKLYLVNEPLREVIEVDLIERRIKPLPISFAAYPEVMEGGKDSGFEGVAVDCLGQRLFVAKQNSPSNIYVIDLRTREVIHHFEIRDDPGTESEPNISDLSFYHGFLYVLSRDAYEIIKIIPSTGEVVERLSFANLEIGPTDQERISIRHLYQTDEPNGLAEGLALSSDRIFLSFDNNESDFTPEAQRFLQPKVSNASLMVTIQRPNGF